MFRYLIRRLMWAFVLFVAVTIVTYVIFYAIPADPARLACGQRATPECIKRAAHYLGTDRPLYVQYGKFFGRLMPFSFTGGPHFKEPSLGRSFTNRQRVNYVVLNAAPVTASLVFGGAVLWMLIALARRRALRAAAAIVARPNSHGLRPHRDLVRTRSGSA